MWLNSSVETVNQEASFHHLSGPFGKLEAGKWLIGLQH